MVTGYGLMQTKVEWGRFSIHFCRHPLWMTPKAVVTYKTKCTTALF